MSICTETITVTTTGSAGSATGTGYSAAIDGYLLDIYFNFHASAASTTDTTVTQEGVAGNLVVITDSKTDVLLAPRQAIVTNANAAITDGSALFPVNGRISIALAQCDALTNALVATVRYATTR
jgi:hypothetical protein